MVPKSRIILFASLVLVLSDAAFAQTSSASRRDQTLMMIASYLGIAEFCTAYGVDFRSVAAPVISGFRENILPKEDPSVSIAFDAGLRSGRLGRLYSLQAGRFVDLPLEGANMGQACAGAHQQVIAISKSK